MFKTNFSIETIRDLVASTNAFKHAVSSSGTDATVLKSISDLYTISDGKFKHANSMFEALSEFAELRDFINSKENSSLFHGSVDEPCTLCDVRKILYQRISQNDTDEGDEFVRWVTGTEFSYNRYFKLFSFKHDLGNFEFGVVVETVNTDSGKALFNLFFVYAAMDGESAEYITSTGNHGPWISVNETESVPSFQVANILFRATPDEYGFMSATYFNKDYYMSEISSSDLWDAASKRPTQSVINNISASDYAVMLQLCAVFSNFENGEQCKYVLSDNDFVYNPSVDQPEPEEPDPEEPVDPELPGEDPVVPEEPTLTLATTEFNSLYAIDVISDGNMDLIAIDDQSKSGAGMTAIDITTDKKRSLIIHQIKDESGISEFNVYLSQSEYENVPVLHVKGEYDAERQQFNVIEHSNTENPLAFPDGSDFFDVIESIQDVSVVDAYLSEISSTIINNGSVTYDQLAQVYNKYKDIDYNGVISSINDKLFSLPVNINAANFLSLVSSFMHNDEDAAITSPLSVMAMKGSWFAGAWKSVSNIPTLITSFCDTVKHVASSFAAGLTNFIIQATGTIVEEHFIQCDLDRAINPIAHHMVNYPIFEYLLSATDPLITDRIRSLLDTGFAGLNYPGFTAVLWWATPDKMKVQLQLFPNAFQNSMSSTFLHSHCIGVAKEDTSLMKDVRLDFNADKHHEWMLNATLVDHSNVAVSRTDSRYAAYRLNASLLYVLSSLCFEVAYRRAGDTIGAGVMNIWSSVHFYNFNRTSPVHYSADEMRVFRQVLDPNSVDDLGLPNTDKFGVVYVGFNRDELLHSNFDILPSTLLPLGDDVIVEGDYTKYLPTFVYSGNEDARFLVATAFLSYFMELGRLRADDNPEPTSTWLDDSYFVLGAIRSYLMQHPSETLISLGRLPKLVTGSLNYSFPPMFSYPNKSLRNVIIDAGCSIVVTSAIAIATVVATKRLRAFTMVKMHKDASAFSSLLDELRNKEVISSSDIRALNKARRKLKRSISFGRVFGLSYNPLSSFSALVPLAADNITMKSFGDVLNAVNDDNAISYTASTSADFDSLASSIDVISSKLF